MMTPELLKDIKYNASKKTYWWEDSEGNISIDAVVKHGKPKNGLQRKQNFAGRGL